MMRLTRPARRAGPLSPLGRTTFRPTGSRPAASAPIHLAPQSFIQQSVMMPDIPDGVVLDGNVTHITSPKPTVEKKYREESR